MRPFGWKMFGIVSSPNPNHICAHLQRVCRTTTCRMFEFFLQNSSCPLARIGSNKSLIQTCSSWCTYVYTESVPVSEMHMLKMGNVFAHHFLTDVSHFIFNISEKQFSISPLHKELSAGKYAGALSCCLMIWWTICNVFCTWFISLMCQIVSLQFQRSSSLSYHSTKSCLLASTPEHSAVVWW